ncbi:arginine deiminase family protein [uncultured Clostridium sp.]|uniref:dimethylarginine dimethylaminohydrolase family protein n=1 Tax=uncultured Clostridium sp. TaxID=59620 RepID=UPI002629C188|nr:arginine deiminase family protein [uncultured Clostridium sp.]
MQINHVNHYDEVSTFIMCYPCNFNLLHKLFFRNVNKPLMFNQYNTFINLLINEKINIQFLDPIYGKNQVFTRDVGFVIDDIFFISKLKNPHRKKETLALKKYIYPQHKKIYEFHNFIEGGDVLVHNTIIFVGLSSRTSIEAVYELQDYLNSIPKNFKVIPIKFNSKKMLHLDCVFNILYDNHAIISNYVYDICLIKKYIPNLYFISNKSARKLGTNFINLGKKRIITSNEEVFSLLKKLKFKPIYCDYSEIMKAGGSFTCSTLPIFRNH